MDLIDRYLQAVGFWLPRDQKEDILAELSEDLYSQVEEREAELGRPVEQSEIEALLKKRGRPDMVAGGYLPKQSLISPILFPAYKLTVKLAAACYFIPWFLVWLGMLIFSPQRLGAPSVAGLFHSLAPLWPTAWILFGVITFIFAVLDRLAIQQKILQNWKPSKLPKVRTQKQIQQKRRREAIGGIIAGAFGLVWLLAVPNFPFLILGPAAFLLKPAPIWHVVYLPILITLILGIAEHICVLLPLPNFWPSLSIKFANTGLTLWILRLLFRSKPYLLAVDPRLQQVAEVTNLLLQLSLFIVGVITVASLLVYIWRSTRKSQGQNAGCIARLA